MITLATADQLDALGLIIFDPHIVPNPNPVLGDSWGPGTGLAGPDAGVDAQLAALIAEPMLKIDGRTLATGYRYTLNVTNALQLRAKHWFMSVGELDKSSFWPASCSMEYRPSVGVVATGGTNSFGQTIGLATCACICHTWASIIRLWLAGNYPLGVTQP